MVAQMDRSAERFNPRPSVARPGRVHDYLLGGKDNFAGDRATGDLLREKTPQLPLLFKQARAFEARAALHMAAHSITQFIQFGPGYPHDQELSDIVGEIQPTARVVYVDNDPFVLSHLRALVLGDFATVECDLATVADSGDTSELDTSLDWSRPVGVLLTGIVHYLPGSVDLGALMAWLGARLTDGSMVAASSLVSDGSAPADVNAVEEIYADTRVPLHFRTTAELEGLFSGLSMLDAGIVPVHIWGIDESDRSITPTLRMAYLGGVAAVSRHSG